MSICLSLCVCECVWSNKSTHSANCLALDYNTHQLSLSLSVYLYVSICLSLSLSICMSLYVCLCVLEGIMIGLSLETCPSNLKSLALTILQLLALNTQKFRRSCVPGHAPFQKIFKGHVRIVPGNMHVKSIAFAILNWSDWPVRCAHTDRQTDRRQTDRQTDRQTSNENCIFAIHFDHLAEII